MESILVPVSEFWRLSELIDKKYSEHDLVIASTQYIFVVNMTAKLLPLTQVCVTAAKTLSLPSGSTLSLAEWNPYQGEEWVRLVFWRHVCRWDTARKSHLKGAKSRCLKVAMPLHGIIEAAIKCLLSGETNLGTPIRAASKILIFFLEVILDSSFFRKESSILSEITQNRVVTAFAPLPHPRAVFLRYYERCRECSGDSVAPQIGRSLYKVHIVVSQLLNFFLSRIITPKESLWPWKNSCLFKHDWNSLFPHLL